MKIKFYKNEGGKKILWKKWGQDLNPAKMGVKTIELG